MSRSVSERNRLALLGWFATVAMSLSFITAVQELRYIVLGALTGLTLVLAGMGLRALRVPTFAVLLLQLVLLVELLVWGFGERLRWGFVPTRRTWSALDATITNGVEHAQEFPAPAPPNPGLLLMLVFFVALIAVLVDFMIAVNKVPLAGLPLLALYTVPVAALPDGVPFLCFLAGAAAYIGLLTAAERDRLAHWGRLVAHGSIAHADDTMDTQALRSSGQRIAALALATAVLVPIFIPTLGSTLLDSNGSRLGSGDGTGGDWRFSDPMVSLASALQRGEEVDLLQVSSDRQPSYLRMAVLDEPGANAWSTGTFDLGDTVPIGSVLPGPTGLDSSIERELHAMTIEPLDDFNSNSAWFPVPFNVSTVDLEDEDWAYLAEDQTVVARSGTSAFRVDEASISYQLLDLTSEDLDDPAPVDETIRERYGDIPDGVPSSLINEAAVITAGAATPYEAAVMLQAFFRDPDEFDYDVHAGYGYGYEAMVEFLEERRGFCQHFAATMAMLARAVGIPSRVVTGFLNPSEAGEDGDDYIFTSHDLHAWPELYFSGVGWVRFEPTPVGGAELPPWASSTNPTPGPSATTPTVTNTENRFTARTTASVSADPSGPGDQGAGGSGSAPSPLWLLPPALLVLVLVPALTRRGIRRHRLTRPIDEASAAEAAWLELRDRMRDLRMPWGGSMTPRAREQSLAPLLRENVKARAALHRLAMCVERARYAVTPVADAQPAQDAVIVMDGIDATVGRRDRLRAFWWPSSLMPDLERAWADLRTRMGRRSSTSET
jgi:hypothetical protein